METAGTAAGWVIFFHLPFISGSSISIGIGSNYSNLQQYNPKWKHEWKVGDIRAATLKEGCSICKDGLSLLLSKNEPHCGDSLCLLHWLCCHFKGDCGRVHMSLKLYSTIASNQSSASSAFPSPGEHGGDSSLLVSPLLVAGVVIGLVLLLSCATIVVGSLRRDSRARRARPGTAAADAPDGFSHGGSSAELRSTCSEELPPACDFDSYLDILSQVNIMYPDPPPCYDECVGPGATQIYIPTDDPPPYSLTDPCQRNEMPGNICSRQEEAARAAGGLREPGSALAAICRCGGGSAVRDSGV